MTDNEFEQQKVAYTNYIKNYIPELFWPDNAYKSLYNILEEDLGITEASLGDYFLKQFCINIYNDLDRIENEVTIYAQNNNYDKIQKEYLFYHKSLLENRINELIQEYISNKTSTKEQPQQKNNSETPKNFIFKNNFDKVKENIIIEYFKTNLVEKKHISETVLNDFLSLAFDKKTLPIQKFSFEKLNTQNDIVQIFYNYYKTTAGKPYGKQKEYLNLLCNYFNGFENFNIKNFSK